MVVEKAVKMAQMMHIPILGLVENMSYMLCPDCGKKLYPFGEGKTQEAAARYGVPLLGRMPIDHGLFHHHAHQLLGGGHDDDAVYIESFQGDWLKDAVDKVLEK